MATAGYAFYDFEPLRKEKRCGIDGYGFFLNAGAEGNFLVAAAVSSPLPPLDEEADGRRSSLVSAVQQEAVHPGVPWWIDCAKEIVREYRAASIALHSTKKKRLTENELSTPNRYYGTSSSNLCVGAPSEWARTAMMQARLRVRRGPIHVEERRVAWQLLTGALFRPIKREEFERLLAVPIAAEHEEVILRDLGRTLPLHCLFKDESSPGQASLRRLLHAYCSRDPVVGYCQGMGFIAAVLLLHMDELSAFGVLWQLMQGRHYRMGQLFEQGFPLLQKMLAILRHLIGRFLPRLQDHLEALAIDPAFFASHWFLTLFAYQFPVPLVCRIWDLFFSEGWKIVFKVALALLQWDEERLLKMSMENVLMHVKVIHENKPPEAIIARAMALPIKERDLRIAAVDEPAVE